MENIKELPSLGLGEAFNNATSKIFQTSGRARRSEFWWTTFIIYILYLLLAPIAWIFDILTIPLTIRRLHDSGHSGWWWAIGVILKIALIICIIYDTFIIYGTADDIMNDKVAMAFIIKYSLFIFVKLIYDIIFLILLCTDSDKYENKYGPSPKYITEDTKE